MKKKSGIVADYRVHDKDTGSPEVQVALLTQRIRELTEHFRVHKGDQSFEAGPAQAGEQEKGTSRLPEEDRPGSL